MTLSIEPRPKEAERPKPVNEPPVTKLRFAHRSLPGGGRLIVALSDGTPIGVIRYDIEGRHNLPLLLQAFAQVIEIAENNHG